MAYSERERIFYIEKMWSEGLRPATAAKLWGAPSRASLAKWERQALAGELDARPPAAPHACEHAKHARYPKETVDEALRLYALGKRPAEIARMLGIGDPAVVGSWYRKSLKEIGGGAPGAGGEGAGEGAAAGEEAGVGAGGGKDGKGAEGKTPREEELERELAAERERSAALELELGALQEILRDPKACGLGSLSNRRKTELGERLRRGFGLSLRSVLGLLDISKSSYEYHRKAILEGRPGRAPEPSAELDALVRASFEGSGGTYGYRRVRADLEASGAAAPERKVRESMRRQGLEARCARRAKGRYSSYEGEASPAPANLLMGRRGRHLFHADAPNRAWVTDVTEMRARGGKIYLSIVVDLYDGRIVGSAVSGRPDAAMCVESLERALATLPDGAPAPLVHSDRGAPYRSAAWIAACGAAGAARSMSRKGCSPDNAACEGVFGTLKSEMYHGTGAEELRPRELGEAVEAYVGWYNSSRLKAFPREGEPAAYETIDGRRRRLGLAV